MAQGYDPVLAGKKALVVGIANEHSIAYGCAKAFRSLGAELAITFLNDKARPHVEPLAKALGARIFLPLDVEKAGELEALFEVVAMMAPTSMSGPLPTDEGAVSCGASSGEDWVALTKEALLLVTSNR